LIKALDAVKKKNDELDNAEPDDSYIETEWVLTKIHPEPEGDKTTARANGCDIFYKDPVLADWKLKVWAPEFREDPTMPILNRLWKKAGAMVMTMTETTVTVPMAVVVEETSHFTTCSYNKSLGQTVARACQENTMTNLPVSALEARKHAARMAHDLILRGLQNDRAVERWDHALRQWVVPAKNLASTSWRGDLDTVGSGSLVTM